MVPIDLGIDVGIIGLIICGFSAGFLLWAFSRVIRLIFELMGSRRGQIRPE